MEQYLNKGIKAVITEHPEVGRILDDFGVGCTTCALGTCLLKDVVGIHNLSPATEAALMYDIESAIYPGRAVERLDLPDSSTVDTDVYQFSPPVQTLVDEHKVIKRWLALIPAVAHALRQGEARAWEIVGGGLALMQGYADQLHHAKEEDILFDYADRASEIIQVMCQDHVQGREHRRMISEAREQHKPAEAAEHLTAYAELLVSHIKREDEILFPWIDRSLSVSQVGEIYRLFADVNAKAAEASRGHLDFLGLAEEWVASRA